MSLVVSAHYDVKADLLTFRLSAAGEEMLTEQRFGAWLEVARAALPALVAAATPKSFDAKKAHAAFKRRPAPDGTRSFRVLGIAQADHPTRRPTLERDRERRCAAKARRVASMGVE